MLLVEGTVEDILAVDGDIGCIEFALRGDAVDVREDFRAGRAEAHKDDHVLSEALEAAFEAFDLESFERPIPYKSAAREDALYLIEGAVLLEFCHDLVGTVTRSVKGDGPFSFLQIIPQVFHKFSLSQVYNSSYWR